MQVALYRAEPTFQLPTTPCGVLPETGTPLLKFDGPRTKEPVAEPVMPFRSVLYWHYGGGQFRPGGGARLHWPHRRPTSWMPAQSGPHRNPRFRGVFGGITRAYKIKRAVRYPFLDFSTLEKRHGALLNELALNRRTAPQLYLEVIPITEGNSGEFRLGRNGEPKEWALVMRRFDQAKLYDRMAEEGRLAALCRCRSLQR